MTHIGQLPETAPQVDDGIFYTEGLDMPNAHVPGEAPDILELISKAIVAKNADNNDPLRRASQAESRHEMNEELEAVIDTIIGIKLIGVATGDEFVVANAESLFLSAVAGDNSAQEVAKSGLELVQSRDMALARKERNSRNSRKEAHFSDAQLADRYAGAEQLGYHHLSIVHATNHEPRRATLDNRSHIDDRFTADGSSRSTVHAALNHLVESSTFSADWSDRRVVIVAPMDETVELNGEPSAMIGHDTWWETTPNEGLVLPDDAIVIKPGASSPIQVLKSGKEIRYKADGITEADVDELLGMANDYELKQVARLLGTELHLSFNWVASGRLADTTLAQYSTKLSSEQRASVVAALKTADIAPRSAAFTDLAKRIAVRLALKAQNREMIEPKTVMYANFMSQDIDREMGKLASGHGVPAVHHSDSAVGLLERAILSHVKRGVFEADDDTKARIVDDIREKIDHIDMSTLHMYYRLGLL